MKVDPEHVFGVQHIGMLLRIYLSNQESRTTLFTQHITIGEQFIECFYNNPLRAGLKNGEHDQGLYSQRFLEFFLELHLSLKNILC